RMLGSANDADDAVQEAWIRLSRSDSSAVENLGGWLTTVVARVSLDMLRSRASRREEPMGDVALAHGDGDTSGAEPEQTAELADSLGPAMLVVLETLSPAERIAFVLHDMFAVPFDEIAPIVGRSPAATRQLASRARRRVQGVDAVAPHDRNRSQRVVEAFLAASRNGDFGALLAMLDPNVVLSADADAVRVGASDLVRGAEAVAQTFSGRARAARLALIDGQPGAVWAPGGEPRVVLNFSFDADKIIAIELLANSGRLDELDLVLLDD
ncbi:MAG: sigma factor-like helix-turn-helix DNA-binding protein, partial [Propionibacteriaceae bacterium]